MARWKALSRRTSVEQEVDKKIDQSRAADSQNGDPNQRNQQAEHHKQGVALNQPDGCQRNPDAGHCIGERKWHEDGQAWHDQQRADDVSPDRL